MLSSRELCTDGLPPPAPVVNDASVKFAKLLFWLIALLALGSRGGPRGLVLALVVFAVVVFLSRRAEQLRSSGQGDIPRGRGREPNMTREEALRVLGLSPGASRAEIESAHRTLIKKIHPDQGGSGYLAQQVNAAKEILVGR